MAEVRSHRDLIVWQKAMDLVTQVYELSSRFPQSELYRLISQMTRSAASLPANIAEGHGRGTARDYAHFVSIAKGSLLETETYLLLPVRLKYVSELEVTSTMALLGEIERMLSVLRKRLVE